MMTFVTHSMITAQGPDKQDQSFDCVRRDTAPITLNYRPLVWLEQGPYCFPPISHNWLGKLVLRATTLRWFSVVQLLLPFESLT